MVTSLVNAVGTTGTRLWPRNLRQNCTHTPTAKTAAIVPPIVAAGDFFFSEVGAGPPSSTAGNGGSFCLKVALLTSALKIEDTNLLVGLDAGCRE